MPRLIVANWKMNPATTEEATQLVSRVEHGLLGLSRQQVETVICPPFLFLPAARMFSHFASLGAQDIAAWTNDDLTGEISGEQLRNFGARYVIVGHSERRELGETEEQIGHKVSLAVKNRIRPILCVGHGVKKSHTAATRKKIMTSQIKNGFSRLKAPEGKYVVIAYEPVWAVGTGRPESPEAAADVLASLSAFAPDSRMLYGGSVDFRNAAAFAAEKRIDGVLVGRSSLKAEDFVKIIKAFA